ncbi:arginine methyl transferase [Coprinopsis marcescibilis]|uniref:Arginine N-methyltransferase 2 n=1 Tax=Coprinopsis marcescibilis TaxID=230819 RepID=A0A5C3LBL0_COPMA|nr:arginine methyl transferase [Coprinopsis marcescibilis]
MDDDDDEDSAATVFGEHLVYTILYPSSSETTDDNTTDDRKSSLDAIKEILDNGAPVWYQNQEEGTSPLHAAAYTKNPELAKILLERGAVWNAVDRWGHTAGDIALSFNDGETYTLIRDAGIRAELLLNLLSFKAHKESTSTNGGVNETNGLLLQEADTTAAGSTDAYLSSKLTYTVDDHGQKVCMVEAGEGEEVGVMMGWEEGIMKESVKRLCEGHPNAQGLRVLNVGFGLGIIDTLFQSLATPPKTHVIIEPHPDVLQHMKETGWYEKPGVTILQGKWQDFVGKEELYVSGGFDVVYTDTFSEDYAALHQFFEQVPDLLAGPDARFSFFNGLGATNALFYDVYTHVSELHLSDIGLDVEWSDVDVTDDVEDRWGKSREYFRLPTYRLPVAIIKSIQ